MSQVVSVVAQRRRNRQFVALQVAPKTRPQALRDLYRVPGFKHEADRDEHVAEPAITQTSTSSR